jgi:hypothetical protein
MGFASGFKVGWDSVGEGLRERERQEMLKGVKDAIDANPEESTGFTAEQGAEIQKLAESGKFNIGYDHENKAYFFAPKSGLGGDAANSPGEGAAAEAATPRSIAMSGVTDFMGKRTAGSLTPGQVQSSRNMAVARAVGKLDPVRGFEMQRQMVRDEQDQTRFDREGERFAQEKTRFDRENLDRAREDEYKTGRQALLAQGNFAKLTAQNTEAQTVYGQALADYEAQVAKGGNQSALIAPQAPKPVRPTAGQMMEDYANLIQHDAKFGKVSTEGLMKIGELIKQIEGEGYTKAMRLAQSGAPLAAVMKEFNANGKSQAKPEDVVSDKMVPGADGVPARVITFKDGTTINALSELNAMGQAQSVYEQFYKARTDKRADDAQKRLDQNDKNDRSDKKAKADAAVGIYKEQNPGATPAQLAAVRQGVIEAVTTADKNAPSEVKLANALRRAGLATSDADALKQALQSKSDSPEKTRAEIYAKALTANMGDAARAKEATEQAMAYLYPAGGAKPGSIASDPRAVAIRDDKTLSIEQKREKLKALGYQ